MNQEERTTLKQRILSRNELYVLAHSRLKRILKSPFRTIPYFIQSAIAYRRPFRVKYRTLWGDPMSFYLPEGGALYYYGFFEANLTNFFINFLHEGDVFLDVGAHVGYYTLLTSKLVGSTGSVHSFEPTPRTFTTLTQNALIRKNIHTNNLAVMDDQKSITFADYGPKYSAFNSFHARGTAGDMKYLTKPDYVTVQTTSIDTYCKSNNLVPTVVKIDAEGAEHIILQAMNNVLEFIRPIVTIEVAGGDEWKDNCKQSINFLIAKNYIPYEITLEGMLRKHNVKDTYVYDNLVFVHTSKQKEVEPYIAI